jgi:hypothetical protein
MQRIYRKKPVLQKGMKKLKLSFCHDKLHHTNGHPVKRFACFFGLHLANDFETRKNDESNMRNILKMFTSAVSSHTNELLSHVISICPKPVDVSRSKHCTFVVHNAQMHHTTLPLFNSADELTCHKSSLSRCPSNSSRRMAMQ